MRVCERERVCVCECVCVRECACVCERVSVCVCVFIRFGEMYHCINGCSAVNGCRQNES